MVTETQLAVRLRAGALLEAWQEGRFPEGAARLTSAHAAEPSLFERERQELLQAVATEMNKVITKPGGGPGTVKDPKIEVCLNLLRHLRAGERT